jgi:hypothetical protein
VAVYGVTQDEHKPEFLAKLVQICEEETYQSWLEGILILFGEERRKIMITSTRDGLFFFV